LRILWLSNYSSPSAYALQSRLYIPRIKACGHDVSVLELANGRFPPRNVGGVEVLPVGKDPFGMDVILEHFQRGGYHAAISLIDPWGLNPEIMKRVPWYAFAPIDTQPVSPRNLKALSGCVRPIALTRWGEEELRVAGMNPLYLPHGFDPAIWHTANRDAAREQLGIPPNVFFAAFVGVNDSLPSRKGLDTLLFAWHILCQAHEDMLLYLHTDVQGNIPERGDIGGVDVIATLNGLQLQNDPRIKLVDVFRYRTFSIPSSELALVAAAADVLVIPSMGEGFCVPIIEFAACGTPSIVTDFGSQAELASQMGGQMLFRDMQWGWQNAGVARALLNAVVSGLETAYQERGTTAGAARRAAAVQGAQAYNIDRVFMEYGIPVLNAIAEATMEAAR
jgi:glycosyltransferase involved in cell wall biosynthesis